MYKSTAALLLLLSSCATGPHYATICPPAIEISFQEECLELCGNSIRIKMLEDPIRAICQCEHGAMVGLKITFDHIYFPGKKE